MDNMNDEDICELWLRFTSDEIAKILEKSESEENIMNGEKQNDTQKCGI